MVWSGPSGFGHSGSRRGVNRNYRLGTLVITFAHDQKYFLTMSALINECWLLIVSAAFDSCKLLAVRFLYDPPLRSYSRTTAVRN
jgi:hypothetical protein